MALHSAPSFESLEKLVGTRDGDLAHRALVDPRRNRGRGAQTNRAGRFETESREAFDDGWEMAEEVKAFDTIEHVERAKTIITRNDSPISASTARSTPIAAASTAAPIALRAPTHSYLGHSAGIEFERDIYVKVNAPELLRQELANPRYRVKPIAMGTNTDPYQPPNASTN